MNTQTISKSRLGLNGKRYRVDENGNPIHRYIENTDGEKWMDRVVMGCAICGESENCHY